MQISMLYKAEVYKILCVILKNPYKVTFVEVNLELSISLKYGKLA